MERFFHIASIVSTFLKFSGAAIAIAAVGIFGFYFIRDNGRSARRGESSVPAKAWRGAGPRKAVRILAVGVLALTLSGLVSLILPGMP
jgi:purine-cytosine permease-like protein